MFSSAKLALALAFLRIIITLWVFIITLWVFGLPCFITNPVFDPNILGISLPPFHNKLGISFCSTLTNWDTKNLLNF